MVSKIINYSYNTQKEKLKNCYARTTLEIVGMPATKVIIKHIAFVHFIILKFLCNLKNKFKLPVIFEH